MTRVALISDSHGNAVGLRAALEDLARHSADLVIHLGDAIQGGSQPLDVIEMLQELACPVIIGNADHFVLSGETVENIPPGMLEVRDWTREQLGTEGLAFMESFVPTHRVDLGGGRDLLCFHGSPKSFDDVLLPETPDDEVESILGSVQAEVLTGGHTHLQWTRRVNDSIFINPGSVGVAYNRHLTKETFYIYPFAEYAIVDATARQISIEFCRVPFDPDEIETAGRASGKPFGEREGSRYRLPSARG